MTRFDAARRAALIQDLLAQARGRPTDLLPFDAVRERLKLRNVVDRGVQEVPLDRVVGTVQREREFNRAFLPREEALRGRWREVEDMAEGLRGFPPVELYRVGDAYFVVDGHHRVSVAGALGAPTIEARVKEFATPVPLSSDASIEDILSREGLAGFLETTALTPGSPDEFRATEPDAYERLLEHIAVNRHFRGIEGAPRDSVAGSRPLLARRGLSPDGRNDPKERRAFGLPGQDRDGSLPVRDGPSASSEAAVWRPAAPFPRPPAFPVEPAAQGFDVSRQASTSLEVAREGTGARLISAATIMSSAG